MPSIARALHVYPEDTLELSTEITAENSDNPFICFIVAGYELPFDIYFRDREQAKAFANRILELLQD